MTASHSSSTSRIPRTRWSDYGHLLRSAYRLSHPIPDMGTPTAGHVMQILDDIDEVRAQGGTAYVHCWGGVGRTGTVIGCWLVRHGLDRGDAIARIAELRAEIAGERPSPETAGAGRARPRVEARMVKRLWLLRHVKSSWDDPGLADHDRPLAPRGRKAAERIRRWASENDVRPDLVLCSTALRARSTLDRVAKGLGTPEVTLEGSLYHASAADLLERLRSVPPRVDGLLVIGHNPALHELACLLAPPGPEALPTGALAELRLVIDGWQDVQPGCAELAWLVVPRSLPR